MHEKKKNLPENKDDNSSISVTVGVMNATKPGNLSNPRPVKNSLKDTIKDHTEINLENRPRFADTKYGTRNVAPDSVKRNIYFLNSTLTTQPISVNINISNHMITPTNGGTVASSRLKGAAKNSSIVAGGRPSAGITPKRASIQCQIKYPHLQTKRMPVSTEISGNHLQDKKSSSPSVKTERMKQLGTRRMAKLSETIAPSPKKCQTLSRSIAADSLFSAITGRKEEDAGGELSFPMTAAHALKVFQNSLSDYEKGEILDYEEIYFIGKGNKTHRMTEHNFGYDDDKGDYSVYTGEHIGYRYEIISVLGKGSFGQAIRCLDHKTKQQVAVKIIRSKKRFYRQAIVEVKVLKYIKDHDSSEHSNVIKMFEYFSFRKHIV